MILKINRCGKSPIAHHAMRRGDHVIRVIFRAENKAFHR
jgi:hypothetical protein